MARKVTKKKRPKNKETLNIVNFLYELGILAKTPRSGFHFLGSGQQSVSEHLFRCILIGYTLARMNKKADVLRVVKMCMFHDLAEARTSDLNYVHQKYANTNEAQASLDLTSTLPFGDDIQETLAEYHERKTIESLLAKDADNLEWILSLRETEDIGNTRAGTWIPSSIKRLKTSEACELGKMILKTQSDAWWFSDKDDEWWVNRKRK